MRSFELTHTGVDHLAPVLAAVDAACLDRGAIVKALPSVITLLRDAQFTDEEVVDWMFRPDDTLPGTPAEALRDNRGTEIKRRAQASGY